MIRCPSTRARTSRRTSRNRSGPERAVASTCFSPSTTSAARRITSTATCRACTRRISGRRRSGVSIGPGPSRTPRSSRTIFRPNSAFRSAAAPITHHSRDSSPIRSLPHRLSPSDRACATIFGSEHVVPVPTVRPSRAVDGRPKCCATNVCSLCPVDSKGTALNMVYPSIQARIDLRSGLLATEVETRAGLVTSVTAMDEKGARHRISARQFVVACNGVDSCLLLQRSPAVPRHSSLGRLLHGPSGLRPGGPRNRVRREAWIRRQRADRHVHAVFRPNGGRSAGVAAWRNPVFDDGERRR